MWHTDEQADYAAVRFGTASRTGHLRNQSVIQLFGGIITGCFEFRLKRSHFDQPRQIRTAPNGDFFVAESGTPQKPGEIKIVRGRDKDGKPEHISTFATGLKRPFRFSRSD